MNSVSTSSSPPRQNVSCILPCVFWRDRSPPGSVLPFPSRLSYSHFWGGMCRLFLRLSRGSGEREGECVRACTSADTVQLQGKPGWNSEPEAPGQAAERPAPWLPSHLCLTPGGFLAGVGEVGIESLSPDSFPDLVGCYPVISQISPHGPFSNTTVSFPEDRRDRREEEADHLRISSPSEDSNENKKFSPHALGTTQDIGYKMNKIISHCYTQRLAIFQSAL